MAAHTRLLVAVGAVDSYWVAPHALSLAHTRSDVVVASVDSYWEEVVHTVRSEHWRSEFTVGATDWNLPSARAQTV